MKLGQQRYSLSIITINYQTDELILDLLKKLVPHTGVEIIIVDNSPTNSLAKKLPQRKDLKYFYTQKNLGFSGGNNYGLVRARGEWLFLLNSDTLTNMDDVLRLLDSTRQQGYFVSAPKLIQPDGKTQNNVGYFDSFLHQPLNYLFARPRFLKCAGTFKPLVVDLLTGAAMMVHKSVFEKVGLLDDQNFFMYFEDLDFSYRLFQAGIKVLYEPRIIITHFGGASSDQDTRQKNKNYQYGLTAYLRKNRGIITVMINNIFHLLS